ncbi:hypothetical protein P171DRAFT_78406 [Karstenula rhodostoma CBS 690.94]|uniref:Uncharacterized protein n=1 Tax=Karstenula rhodostoma CBS 690.94 TaxID=1392251 RepID=A0A9P4PB34_9PLEO|nr:hypothetical protein P171DRAFT_78406 [Karstenula rhodostoma CBS 690.94]
MTLPGPIMSAQPPCCSLCELHQDRSSTTETYLSRIAWCLDSMLSEPFHGGLHGFPIVAFNRNGDDVLRIDPSSRVQVHEQLGGGHLSALGLVGLFGSIRLDTLHDERKDMVFACVRERETFTLRAGDDDFLVPVEDRNHAGDSSGAYSATVLFYVIDHVQEAVHGDLYELSICERAADPPVGHKDDAVRVRLCPNSWRVRSIILRFDDVKELSIELYANSGVCWLFAGFYIDGLCSVAGPQQDLEESEGDKLIKGTHVCKKKTNGRYSRRPIPKERM